MSEPTLTKAEKELVFRFFYEISHDILHDPHYPNLCVMVNYDNQGFVKFIQKYINRYCGISTSIPKVKAELERTLPLAIKELCLKTSSKMVPIE